MRPLDIFLERLGCFLVLSCPVALELPLGECGREVLNVKRPKRIPTDFTDPDDDAEGHSADRTCADILSSSAVQWDPIRANSALWAHKPYN